MKILHFGALLLALSAAPALAQDDFTPPTPEEAAELVARPLPPAELKNGARELTATDVEAYADGLVPAGLAQGDMAGAVVVVVKDGRILFQKGYGFADVAARKPVDPLRTLFRPGSVSKLFTWTAVMQLVGAGKLDLDVDVNRYLDFTIPPAFGKPITLRNLMTHSAGFEENFRAVMLGDPDRVMPLDEIVRQALPERLFPPGDVPAYSNYGATLAGYIVQRVSGEEFTAYIQRHIFAPLGMTHATFVQPLPAALRGDMSMGYDVASDPVKPFEVINFAPAGGLSASGADLARFMIAHLGSGAFGAARILSPEMAVRMHGTAFRPLPALLPMAYGFHRTDVNGHRMIAHGGDTGIFHSDMELILDANTGVFLSMNSSGTDGAAARLRRAFLKGFMNRYFPAPAERPLPTLKTALADGTRIAGDYVTSRRADSNFTRYIFLLQPQDISVNADATISVSLLHDPAGHEKHWREVGPFVWQEAGGRDLLQATFKDGHVDQVGSDAIGPVVLMPAGFAAASWNLWLLIATGAVLALTIAFWPVKAVLRWRYERPLPLMGRARLLYRLTRVVALLDLIFLAGFPLVFIVMVMHFASMSPDIDWVFRGLQLVGLIGVVGTAVPVAEFAVAIRDPARPWWTKASDLLIVLAALATVWFAFSQHLLTVSLKY